MEHHPSQQVIPRQKNILERLSYLISFGFLELIFIVILLFIIFGLLDYLNIISIRSNTVSKIVESITNNSINKPVSIQESAQKYLASTINQFIKFPYLPPNSTYKYVNQAVNLNWKQNNIDFKTSATYKDNVIEMVFLSASVQNTTTVAPSIHDVSNLTSKYFQTIDTSAKFKCNKLGTYSSSICEHFEHTPTENKGYGVIFRNNYNKTSTSITFFCRIPQQSSLFNKSTSCFN